MQKTHRLSCTSRVTGAQQNMATKTGYNIHVKQQLLRKQTKVFKSFSNRKPGQKVILADTLLEKSEKIYHGIIVLQRLIDLRQMVLQNG